VQVNQEGGGGDGRNTGTEKTWDKRRRGGERAKRGRFWSWIKNGFVGGMGKDVLSIGLEGGALFVCGDL